MVQIEVASLDTNAEDKACRLTSVQTKEHSIGIR